MNTTWLLQTKENNHRAFLQRGFPTKKEERWKYTEINANHIPTNSPAFIESQKINVQSPFPKLVFINGHYSSALSDHQFPDGVIFCGISDTLRLHENHIKPFLEKEYDAHMHPFASLNMAKMSDGFFLYVPKNICLHQPLHCIFLNTENNFQISPRNILIAETQSRVTIIEEHQGLSNHYFSNNFTSIDAHEHAHVYYHKIQNESINATHVANIFVSQKQSSVVKTFSLSLGANLTREDIYVASQSTHAETEISGFYHLTQQGQHADHHLHVNHTASKTRSKMFYKGILSNKSRAIFNGKVHVHAKAQQIEAQQANRNLLLSKEAEVNTKPELEIYADDVKCTHGATVGYVDDEAIFYLRSRGIDKETALQLLIHAFSDEVFNIIENAEIKQYLQKVYHEKL